MLCFSWSIFHSLLVFHLVFIYTRVIYEREHVWRDQKSALLIRHSESFLSDSVRNNLWIQKELKIEFWTGFWKVIFRPDSRCVITSHFLYFFFNLNISIHTCSCFETGHLSNF
ncbi:hypothetical protein CW304_28715 [Bacillus sp. UFRGS-B20]|nr:hypothetical protein CW304_28715 [Bacillus sp. UFRGS-B20]